MHKFSKPLLCQTPNKAKSSQPVNFETTNEEFYRPVHSPASLVMPGFTRSPLPEAKFMGKTSYGSNFMNWGSGGVYYVTEQHIKHTSQEMQLHGKSSYQDNYVKIQDEELLKPRRLGKEVARLQKHLGLRISNAKIMKESVSKKDFQDYSKKALTTREKRDYQTIPVVKSINSHYLTMAQTDYIAHPMQVDHRNLRKQHERNKKLL